MTDPKKMSVEEILAACRQQDGGGTEPAPPPTDQGGSGDATSEPEAAQAPAAPTKPASQMSVEEMLAAARAEKTGGGAKPAAASKPAASKPSGSSGKKPSEMSVEEMLAAARGETSKPAAKATAKPRAKQAEKKAAPQPAEAAAVAEGPKETESILAAARKASKPGPISKAEAAAKAERRGGAAPTAKKKGPVPPMPEKPAYARPAPARTAEAGESRRSFFASFAGVFVGSSLAAGFTSLLVTHVLWLLGLARFMFPNILTEPPTKFKVGFPDDYAPGQVETKFKAEFGIWLVRYEYEGQPQIYAIQSVCTHLGCTPNWLEGEQKFKCPCHGSGFYKDGINFEGPAPRPLERFAIQLADDGQLQVDKSRKFLEEKGEWKDSASFVPV